MSAEEARDVSMRLAAVEQLRRRAVAGVVSSDDLAAGFTFAGERIRLLNPQRGIFKPRTLRYRLSVRTVFPVSGRKVWYKDQRRVHGQIHDGDELVDYSFMVGGPGMAENRHLHDAMLAGVPILYLLGVAPKPLCTGVSNLRRRLVGGGEQSAARLRRARPAEPIGVCNTADI